MNQPQYIENRTFDELQTGDSASIVRQLTLEEMKLFAVMSGDLNPTVLDESFAQSQGLPHNVGYGMWGGALISSVLGTHLPGPGTLYVSQNLRFLRPVEIGDTVTVTCTVHDKNPENHHVVFDCEIQNQRQEVVVAGRAIVLAPREKVHLRATNLPDVRLNDPLHGYRQLMALTTGLDPIPMAVVHPCDKESLRGAIDAAHNHLIVPILVGPKTKIESVARECDVSLEGIEIVDVPHSHAAAVEAVRLVRTGRAGALMKGSLHTDEYLGAIVASETGLRTGRRLSQVFVMDVPNYPKPLMITDAAVNIEPTLEDKRDIVQNAIDLCHALGLERPKVAILAAIETVNPKMKATLDAAALCKMSDRGQITGGELDGPLAFDNAISATAAKTKGIVSPVAGQADILLAPDLEAGNMMAKQLQYLADAQAAGIVLGAKVPIVLTSRADSAGSRMASCAIAMILAHYQQRKLAA